MPTPISVVLFDKGAAGAPTTTNPQPLRGLDGYTHTTSDRFGFESASCGWPASRADVLEWARADHLGRHMEAFSPDARRIWEGQLVEIAITFGTKKLVFALKDMANRLTLRYTATTGAQATTTVYSSAGSIAAFGTKDRLLSLSTVAATAADNRVQTALNQIAYPTVKQASDSGTGGGGELRVDLTFAGWYWTLDWLLTSSSSTTSTATNTQVASLLTAFNSTNAFFHATADLVATGLSDTEYIDDNSTYREKIETLLAHGNSSKQRLAWGVYEDRRFRAEVWAGASPTTTTYYEHAASGRIVDAAGNAVEPWNVRPNAMAQILDVLDSTMDGAVEGPGRKYVARVTCRIDSGGASVTLEPDSVDTLDALLSSPTGAGPAGTSERQAAFERKVIKPARTVFSGTDGRVDLDGGSITTPGGVVTITPPGGGTVTLPTGTTTVLDGSGTTGELAKWTGANTLGDAVGGTDYAEASHTHTPSGTGLAPLGAKYIVQQSDPDLTNEQSLGALATGLLKNTTTSGVLSIAVAGTDYVAPSALNELIDDRVAALLVAGTGISLSYNDAGNALTISNTGGTVGGSGTAGRLMQWASGGTDAENSTLAKTGAGVLTLSAAGAATLTIDASIRLTGSGASSGDALIYNGTAFAPTTLTPAAIGAAPSDAKYIVQQASAGLSAEQALGSLASGLLKNTTTTGVLSIAVAGTDYAAAAHTHTTTDVTNFAEAVDDRVAALLVAGSGIGLSYNDAGNVLTIANTGGTVGGTGTAGRVPQWATGGADLENSTLIKTGAGLLTLNATTTEQVQIASGGTLDLNNNVMVFPVPGSVPTGVGVNKNLVFWNSTNGVSPAANLYWDSNNGRLGINSATPAYRLELGFDSAAKPSTNTWTVVSDVRTKYPGSIVPFRDGLAALLQLRPVRFTYNGAAGTPKGGRGVGLIAQEVARVIPRWIRRSRGKLRPHDLRETELLSVNSGDFDLMVINALREIADRLTALEQ